MSSYNLVAQFVGYSSGEYPASFFRERIFLDSSLLNHQSQHLLTNAVSTLSFLAACSNRSVQFRQVCRRSTFMSLPPSRTTKTRFCLVVVALYLLGLLLVSLLVIGLFSGRLPAKPLETGVVFINALVFLLWRIKKFRERRRNGRQIAWYTQPGILLALAMLLSVPSLIINLVTNDDSILIVTLIPSILVILAAAFFLIKWFMNPFAD